LCAPRKIQEATALNSRYRRYEEIQNVEDRLRWCRHSKGLRQIEVAAKTGMSLTSYKELEKGTLQRVQLETMERLAMFFGVPLTDLLDEFNRFCYDGQSARIRAYRESSGLDMKTFAREKGIPLPSLRSWENGKNAVSMKSWERYFKGRA
jgi:transcriptional regulator with XRE-family HTH domain